MLSFNVYIFLLKSKNYLNYPLNITYS
ncbi:Immunoglobulin [Escherichia coli]|uniref:Uncharacterized protein n=1 Tax=Escherichia coli O157:H7 TaxID=83334 RepID=Q8X463_ECO57|nr:hypothetical protein Z1532 [Escherichia coli O157:H7 str. EDL933]